MIGSFTCTYQGEEVQCEIDDAGGWSSDSDELAETLNDLFAGEQWQSPAQGAFMRSAFREAAKALKGEVTYLREPSPLPEDALP
jgi:hypothetical protein